MRFFFSFNGTVSSSFITIVTSKAFFVKVYMLFMYTYMYEYTSVYVCTPFTQNCEKLFGTSS